MGVFSLNYNIRDRHYEIATSEQESVLIVKFTSMDIGGMYEIADSLKKIADYVEERMPMYTIFDFNTVSFFSSRLLGALVDLRNKTDYFNGEIMVAGLNPQLYRVFKITCLDQLFSFFPDTDHALAEIRMTGRR